MSSIDQIPSDERPHFLRRSALASICLLLVAGLHLYRVAAYDQSRWKGGGFGMFSTVDAETARFLRVYLVDEAGVELPVRIPASLNKRALVLRALPQRDLALELADRLLELRWQQADRQAAGVAQLLKRLPADRPVTAADLDFQSFPEPTAGSIGERSDWEPVAKSANANVGLRPTAVRVELWRHRFDSTAAQLHAEQIFSVTQVRKPEGTQ